MISSNRFLDNGASDRFVSGYQAKQAFSFAWSKAQECLVPFGAWALCWGGLYGALILALFFLHKPFVGVAVRLVAGAGAVFFLLWFASVTLDIAKGRRADVRAMARAFRPVADPVTLAYALASFAIVAVIAMPGVLVTALATSLPFVAPVFAIALVAVSWLYIFIILALHANIGFVVITMRDSLVFPASASRRAMGEAGKTVLRILSEARAVAERNGTQYAALWLYGIGACIAGAIPSIVTAGVGFIFLALFFGIALARMYVGACHVKVPVSHE